MVRHFGKFGDALDVEYRDDGRVFLLIGQKAIGLPRHKGLRITVGVFITIIGLLPLVPITVVGLLILSADVPWLGRARHKIVRAVTVFVNRIRGQESTKTDTHTVPALSNSQRPK